MLGIESGNVGASAVNKEDSNPAQPLFTSQLTTQPYENATPSDAMDLASYECDETTNCNYLDISSRMLSFNELSSNSKVDIRWSGFQVIDLKEVKEV